MSEIPDTQTMAPAFLPDLLQQLLADRKTAGDIEDLLKDLRKAFIEHALQGELTHLLGYEKHAGQGRKSGNSRNGTSRKTVKAADATLEIAVPRDRNGEFEPQLIGKHERRWEGFDELILALYARGMSGRDIQDLLRQKYDVDVSPQLISDVCASVSAGVDERDRIVELQFAQDSQRSQRLSQR